MGVRAVLWDVVSDAPLAPMIWPAMLFACAVEEAFDWHWSGGVLSAVACAPILFILTLALAPVQLCIAIAAVICALIAAPVVVAKRIYERGSRGP